MGRRSISEQIEGVRRPTEVVSASPAARAPAKISPAAAQRTTRKDESGRSIHAPHKAAQKLQSKDIAAMVGEKSLLIFFRFTPQSFG